MELQEAAVGLGNLFERPFSAEDRKILLDVVKNDAPELLQPTAIRRINREIWERMLTKFNTTANREWNVRQFKMCLQHLVRKTMQKKGGSQAQMLVSRRLQVHRFTSSEKKLLTNLVKDHLVLFSKQKDGDTIMAKRKGWTTMMWSFNRSPGIEGQRTAREIKTCVMNMLNRSKNKDVLELKDLIAAMNEAEMNPDDAEACTEVEVLSVEEEPRESIPSMRPSLQSSMTMSGPNRFILPQQSLLQTSHPSAQILAAMQQKMNRAPPNHMPIQTSTIAFPTLGEAQSILGLQASSAQPLHLASGIYHHASSTVQGQHPPSSTITQDPEAHLAPVAITSMTSRGDESFNRSDSPVQVIEIKDEVVSDDADEQFQEATHTESQNVTQLEKVRKDIPSFTEPTNSSRPSVGKNGLNNIQIRIHDQRMVSPHQRSPHQSAITPPGQRISSAEDSDTSYSTTHSFPHGDTGQSSYLQQQSPEQTPRQSMFSEGRRSRGEAHNSAGVIEKRPVGIMGPKRAMGRREPSANGNHNVRSEMQEVQRDPSRSQDPQSIPRQQGAAGSSRTLVGGSPRKESLGKMKRRLLQEQHDVRISLMREEHAWHLEEHNWKREEHELRMSMIRINSKI